MSIAEIKENCKSRKEILKQLKAAIKSLMDWDNPFSEQEPCVLINESIQIYKIDLNAIRKYKHGNWDLYWHGWMIDMMDIESVKFMPGHGV